MCPFPESRAPNSQAARAVCPSCHGRGRTGGGRAPSRSRRA
ncbi:hypothetical protein SGM_4758 [Streptomyces griseoaurantiacus M045]|uniref:Uncharacterized protein n=1 Tax=Streptomyces griseoaurantiacus M045 TaxID=996637 RepID=F3NNP4_9ACTN|nr:hypothetical protein SGM_4758 [Streptomyces griseoaurantiacus M045]